MGLVASAAATSAIDTASVGDLSDFFANLSDEQLEKCEEAWTTAKMKGLPGKGKLSEGGQESKGTSKGRSQGKRKANALEEGRDIKGTSKGKVKGKRRPGIGPATRPGKDIGNFGFHKGAPGVAFLTSAEVADRSSVFRLIQEIGGMPDATFKSYPDVCLLGQEERAMLMEKLDQKCGNQQDYKWTVTPSCLRQLIGQESFEKVAEWFPGGDFNEIKLRRCSAQGQCINFHTDFSECTMQIPLNSDTEYVGGRLMFATSEGLQCPPRPAGSITMHCNDIVHGVTRMEQGVRYGLFFLKNS